MKFTKIVSIMTLFMILSMLLLPNVVFAAEAGWPVDTEEETEEVVGAEEVIEVEEVIQPEEVVETTGELSAIDQTTKDLEEDPTFGEEYDLVNRLTTGASTEDLEQSAEIYSMYSDVVPVVTTSQMVEWVLRKGNEAISIAQVLAQPFTVIVFIISAFICLIGTLSKGNMAGKGLMGMFVSALVYAAVLYAPLLVNTIVGWASS